MDPDVFPRSCSRTSSETIDLIKLSTIAYLDPHEYIARVSRDGPKPYAPACVHQGDVQDAEPSLPDAAWQRALHERRAECDALLEGGIAAVAEEDHGQDAPYPVHVSARNLLMGRDDLLDQEVSAEASKFFLWLEGIDNLLDFS